MAQEAKDTPTERQCIAALDAISCTVVALRCLDTLLDTALLHDGGVLSDKNSGLHFLLSRQLDDIDACEETLRRFVRASSDRAETSRGLPPDMVILPTYRPGMEHELRTKAEGTVTAQSRDEPTATELREALIAEKLREGVEPAIIAQAMNLRKSAVDKVAAKLTAEAQDALPAAKAG